MKRIITCVLVLVLVASVFVFGFTTKTRALEPVREETKSAGFAIVAKQMCETVALSWQKQSDALFYNVYKDNKLIAELSEFQTTWIDEEPDEKKASYKVESLNEELEVMGTSWELDAGKRCQVIESNKLEMQFKLNDKNYKVNGKHKGVMDAEPEIKHGRMFLVIRYITEALGAEIGWDGKEKRVTITTEEGKVIDLWIGKPDARIDGEMTKIDSENLDIVPYVSAGRTLLPMRFVANLLGADGDDGVVWDAETKTVTLNFGEDLIIDFDIWELMVVSANPSEWTVTAFDDVRNTFTVLLNEEFSGVSETAQTGDIIKVAGDIESDGYSFKIEPRWAEVVEFDEKNKNYVCKPQNARDGVAVIASGDEPTVLTYSPLFEQIENSVDKYWVNVVSDENDNIVSMRVVVFEPESDECESNEFVYKIKGVNRDKGKIHLELDDGEDVKETWMYFMPGDPEFGEVETDDCMVVTCSKNYLGNVFVTKLDESDCPVPFKLSSENESLRLFPGGKVELGFNILNEAEIQSDFDIKVLSRPVDGEIVEEQTDVFVINGKKSHDLKYNYTAPDTTGDYQVGIEVSTGLISKAVWMDIKCEEADFTFEPTKLETTRFKVNDSFFVKFYISQDFDCPMTLEPLTKFKEGIFVIDSTFETFTLDSNEKKLMTVDLLWGDDATFNKEYSFEFGVSLGELEKTEIVKFKALGFEKPSLRNVKAKLGRDMKVTLEGEVDWKDVDGGELIVDWGDGEESTGEEFPFTHFYSKAATYTIKVTARVHKGIESSVTTTVKCYVLPDPPEITKIDGEMPGEYTLRLSFKINWHGNKKGKLHIDWGDGKSEVTSKTTVTHKYPSKSGMLYFLTFKAVSADGYESEEKMWMIMVYKNEIEYVIIN